MFDRIRAATKLRELVHATIGAAMIFAAAYVAFTYPRLYVIASSCLQPGSDTFARQAIPYDAMLKEERRDH